MTDWYTGRDRHERIQQALERHSFDVLIAITPENAGYLAGQSNFLATHWRIPGIFSTAVGTGGNRAVVSGDFGVDPATTLPYTYFPYVGWTESVDVRPASGSTIAERVVTSRPGGPRTRPAQFDLDDVFDRVAEAIRSVANTPRRIGIDLLEVDFASVARIASRFPDAELIDATPVLDDLRALKDADEIAHLRLAGELTEIGIAGAVAKITPGMSALAVNSAYQIAVHERVIGDSRFSLFRQAEGVASIGIGAASPNRVVPGETIKFDMQVDIAGYHSDIGRTYAIDPTAEQLAVYTALRDALLALQVAVQPGVTFAELHAIGSQSMFDAGYTNYSRGHLGHSVGLTQRFEEPPFIAPDEHRPVVAGMMLSLELPYYIYGVGAFQMERMVLVTKSGTEAIDQLPFEMALNLTG